MQYRNLTELGGESLRLSRRHSTGRTSVGRNKNFGLNFSWIALRNARNKFCLMSVRIKRLKKGPHGSIKKKGGTDKRVFCAIN